jgi:hypothetical protein
MIAGGRKKSLPHYISPLLLYAVDEPSALQGRVTRTTADLRFRSLACSAHSTENPDSLAHVTSLYLRKDWADRQRRRGAGRLSELPDVWFRRDCLHEARTERLYARLRPPSLTSSQLVRLRFEHTHESKASWHSVCQSIAAS